MLIDPAMQAQARALADPSRFRIFQFVAEAEHAVTVAELTDLLGFNHNAIRQHLAVLTNAGLIAEFDEVRTTRGRPRKQYRLRRDALRAFRSVSGSYERLATLLLELHQSDETAFDIGFRAGSGATPPSVDANTDPMTTLVQLLMVEGFDPERSDESTITLQHCPFADVAEQNPGVICELHRGLLAGAAAQHDTALAIALTPKPARTAGCVVTGSNSATTDG